MGAAMVPGRIQAARCFNGGRDLVAHRYLALLHRSALYYQSRHRALGILHHDDPVGTADGPPVAQLPAALGVEGGLADDDLHLLALACVVHRHPAGKDGGDL